MSEWIVVFGGMKVYWLSLLVMFSFMWGAYVFYRQAITNYFEEVVIYDAVLLTGIVSFLISRVMYVVLHPGFLSGNWARLFLVTEYPGLSGWGVVIGVWLTTWFLASRLKKDIYDWWDMAIVALTAGWGIVKAGLAILMIEDVMIWWKLPVNLLEAILITALFWGLWFLEKEYRTFGWYRFRRTEARAGLVTGVGVAGMAVIEAILMIWRGWNWIGGSIIIALIVASGLIVYTRSGRSLKTVFKLKK